MSQTSNLLHAVCIIYPFTMGFRPECRSKSNEGIHEYIDCYCKSPGLCTWCLMTNRRRRSSSAAAPGYDIARPSTGAAESWPDGSRAASTCHDCHNQQHESTDHASHCMAWPKKQFAQDAFVLYPFQLGMSRFARVLANKK